MGKLLYLRLWTRSCFSKSSSAPRIEIFVVLSVRPLHLAVMPRRIGAYLLVLNAVCLELLLEQCQITFLRLRECFRELRPVVRLHFQDGERKIFHEPLEKYCGGICTLLIECGQVAHPCVLVDGGVLVQLPAVFRVLPGEAGARDNLDVDLHFLPGECRIVVGLRLVLFLGVLKFRRAKAEPAHAAEQSRDGTLVALAPQLYPENDKAVMGIAAEHVLDERYLLLCMLVRMGFGAAGLGLEGFGRTVIPFAETVDKLAVCAVLDGGFCDAVFFGVGKNR